MEAMVASKSLARRRLRLIQAKNRSTTQRRGSSEADLIGQLADDLHHDGCRVGDALAGIGAVGKHLLD